MKKIRVGVVGFGHRGRLIAQIAGIFEQVEVVAGCDILPRNWYEKQWLSEKAMAEIFPDAAFYEDYDKMLEEVKLDVVIVETGADIHAEFCKKALENNINVFTDIPVVANLKEAEDLWKASQKSKATIYVGANPNYQKFAYLLKEFYDKGLLGKPYCMEAEYIHWSLPNSEMSKGLNENGDWRKLLSPIRYCTHSLGPLKMILDEPLRKVCCFGTGAQTEESKKDDMVCAQFQTDSGVIVRLMRNGRCRADIGHHNYRVFGTEGYMERIERFEQPVIRYNSQKELDTGLKETSGEYMPPAYKDNPKANIGHGGLDYAMLDNYFKALVGENAYVVTLKEGLEITLPGIYAEESAKRGGAVLRMVYPWDEDWSTEIK